MTHKLILKQKQHLSNMKKLFITIIIASAVIACKKENKAPVERTETQYIRIEAVDKDGTITLSPTITVKVIK